MKLLVVLLLVSCTTTTYEEPPVEPNNAWEKCEPFLTHDGETWANCMLIA